MIFLNRIVSIAKFSLEVCEQLIIQGKLSLQRSIGHPSSAADEVDHLIEHRVEVHYHPSTCASAASACGSQNVISMARYRSMAAAMAVRACSARPVWPYSRPRSRWQC